MVAAGENEITVAASSRKMTISLAVESMIITPLWHGHDQGEEKVGKDDDTDDDKDGDAPVLDEFLHL